jgi:hypothetical protein
VCVYSTYLREIDIDAKYFISANMGLIQNQYKVKDDIFFHAFRFKVNISDTFLYREQVHSHLLNKINISNF